MAFLTSYIFLVGRGHPLAALLLLALFAAAYFVPTIIAAVRHHHQLAPILVINLLLGWTFIGWVVALAMSVSHIPPQAK